MNDYYLNFILENLKKDIINSLNKDDQLQNINDINKKIMNEINIYFKLNNITF